MNRRSWVVVFLVVLATIGFVGHRVIRPGRRHSARPPSSAPAATSKPHAPSPVQVHGGTYREKNAQGRLLYEITFETGEFDAANRLASARGVKARLAQAKGPAIVVEAPVMSAAQSDRAIRFASGANARIEDGSASFSASSLVWQMDTRKLIGESGGTFQWGELRLSGNRLVWDTKAQRVRISGGGRLVRPG